MLSLWLVVSSLFAGLRGFDGVVACAIPLALVICLAFVEFGGFCCCLGLFAW